MGIPKFFRYIAQRWPLTSQVVNDNIIPEFDNMYLDMNSIVHMCTHANADNVGHLDEAMTFQNIGNYIEHLFTVIDPKEIFFMAIDGVAPRAKMNQQRARRFRSAKDAEDTRRKALERGQELDEDPFDSNCITPGTEFMANLTKFLKYFVARKITEDSKWQNCKIILSGHEVPGEGEHKIMNFIRNLRSQSDYNPNTRHCLYGLDADLIMLGLSTHEPHFSLLREEVAFEKKVQFQSAELAEKRFILLHISLVRDYIELELDSPDYKEKPDFERMLDDIILILFFVGNDFLPELPMLLINEGAIPVIFDTYKRYLQASNNSYLSINGKIDFLALKGWLDIMKSYQFKKFEEQTHIEGWFTKQMETESVSGFNDIILSVQQHALFEDLVKFMTKAIKRDDTDAEVVINEEKQFVSLLAEQTGFTYQDGKLKLQQGAVPAKDALRILRIYKAAKVNDPKAKEDYEAKMLEWKNRYYARKFGDSYDSEKVRQVSLRYLEGLQWVLYYYYKACPSWSWFYDDHYAPMITEIITAIGDGFEPEFQLGEPFKPFEQLMSVLPDRSIKLIPPALRHLVLEENSPIIDFYPHSFEVDKNGKKADWEAVVLIPFIDGDRLLKYVRPIEAKQLTDAEKLRNANGEEIEFYFDPNQSSYYPAPVSRLPSIEVCTCISRPLKFQTHEIRYGRIEGSSSGVDALAGYPTLKTLPFEWSLQKESGVKVFERPSRDDSVVLSIKPATSKLRVGNTVYINWPFLHEARITSIRAPDSSFVWHKLLPRVQEEYRRVGVDIGEVEAQVGVRELQGLQRHADGSYVKDFDGPDLYYPAQMVTTSVKNEDPRFLERKAVPIESEFPVDSSALLLLAKFYGYPATIKEHDARTVAAEATVSSYRDPAFSLAQIALSDQRGARWYSMSEVARSAELPMNFLMVLTSRLMVEAGGKKLNIALPLRKHSLGLMAEGYSRQSYKQMWELSDKGVAILVSYLSKFKSPLLAVLKKNEKSIDPNVLTQMKTWVDEHTKKFIFVPVSSSRISDSCTAHLEQKVRALPPPHLEKVYIKGIERGALLSPSDAHHQLRSQKFQLGDRVVSALDYGKVPLYTRGIVIGVHRGATATASLDIIWDYEFDSASDLDGRLSTKRGLNVLASSVLNLSNPQIQYSYKRAPTVTKIRAKVDTRSTPAAKTESDATATSTVNKNRFVPAPKRDDWKMAKQAKMPPAPQAYGYPVNPMTFVAPPPNVYSAVPAPVPVPASASGAAAPTDPSLTNTSAPGDVSEETVSAPSANPKLPSEPKTDNKASKGRSDRNSKGKKTEIPHERGSKAPRRGAKSKASKSDRQTEGRSAAPPKRQIGESAEPAQPAATMKEASLSFQPAIPHRAADPEATRKLLSKLFSKEG